MLPHLLRVAASRIYLGLKGHVWQSILACSSSLVALDTAFQSMQFERCESTLVGGVNLALNPDSWVAMSTLQALAADGCCKTFDAAADGYGRGEAAAGIVLQKSPTCVPQLAGCAVNQDGRSASFMAPSGLAQMQVMTSALQHVALQGSGQHSVESHGTGTALGDPIEMQALMSALSKKRPPAFTGAVKSRTGHAEISAGVLGLCRTVLSMEFRTASLDLHLKRSNPVLEKTLIGVLCSQTALEPNASSRTAGVSSFGYSGTNAARCCSGR